jgi:hypothetical protein
MEGICRPFTHTHTQLRSPPHDNGYSNGHCGGLATSVHSRPSVEHLIITWESHCMVRVGQNHIFTVYIRSFGREIDNLQSYTVHIGLARTIYLRSYTVYLWYDIPINYIRCTYGDFFREFTIHTVHIRIRFWPTLHTHTHTHTHIHTHKHTLTYTHIHTRIHTHTFLPQARRQAAAMAARTAAAGSARHVLPGDFVRSATTVF